MDLNFRFASNSGLFERKESSKAQKKGKKQHKRINKIRSFGKFKTVSNIWEKMEKYMLKKFPWLTKSE